MPIELSVPVQLDRDRIAKQADEANIRLQELQRLYRESPDQKIERDNAALERLRSDPHYLGRSLVDANVRREAEVLEGRIQQAKQVEASTPVVMTDAQRVDQIASGKPLNMQDQTTVDGQLTNRDFAGAVADLLEGGVRVDLALGYLEHGRSDDPRGHEFAAEWFRQLEHDPELQQKLLRGDPEIRRRFLVASMYMAGRHDQPA